MLVKLLIVISHFTALALTLQVPASLAGRAATLVPFEPVGGIAAIQRTDGIADIFYQQPDGSIWRRGVNHPFDTASDTNDNVQIIPADEVGLGTPIAVAQVEGALFTEVHVVYFSPTNVLSEAIWTATINTYRSGAACAECLTHQNAVVEAGSKMLYVMLNQENKTLRVGFQSAGAPGTVSELDNETGNWNVATMP